MIDVKGGDKNTGRIRPKKKKAGLVPTVKKSVAGGRRFYVITCNGVVTRKQAKRRILDQKE